MADKNNTIFSQELQSGDLLCGLRLDESPGNPKNIRVKDVKDLDFHAFMDSDPHLGNFVDARNAYNATHIQEHRNHAEHLRVAGYKCRHHSTKCGKRFLDAPPCLDWLRYLRSMWEKACQNLGASIRYKSTIQLILFKFSWTWNHFKSMNTKHIPKRRVICCAPWDPHGLHQSRWTRELLIINDGNNDLSSWQLAITVPHETPRPWLGHRTSSKPRIASSVRRSRPDVPKFRAETVWGFLMLFGPSPVRFWDVHVSGYIRMWGLRHLGLSPVMWRPMRPKLTKSTASVCFPTVVCHSLAYADPWENAIKCITSVHKSMLILKPMVYYSML